MGGPCLRDPGSDSDGDTAVFLRHCVMLRVRDHSEMVHARQLCSFYRERVAVHGVSSASCPVPRASAHRNDGADAARFHPGGDDSELRPDRAVQRTVQGKDTAAASDKDKQDDEAAATAEKNKPDSEKSEDEKKSEKKSGDPAKVIKDASVDPAKDEKTKDAAGTDGKGGVKDVKDKVEGTNEGGNNAAKTSAFGLGASVGVVSNQNDVNVTLGKNAVITAAKQDGAATADGSVNVVAKTLLTASTGKEDSLQFTVKNAQANSAKVEIGAAVLVSNVKNNAKKHKQITD